MRDRSRRGTVLQLADGSRRRHAANPEASRVCFEDQDVAGGNRVELSVANLPLVGATLAEQGLSGPYTASEGRAFLDVSPSADLQLARIELPHREGVLDAACRGALHRDVGVLEARADGDTLPCAP